MSSTGLRPEDRSGPAHDGERLVRDFLARMGPTPHDVEAAVEDFLTDDCVWQNPGTPLCRGKRRIMELMPPDFAQLDVRFLHMATSGDTVLAERVEDMLRVDGSPIAKNLKVMAAFEIRDGRIRAWRDYFDITNLISGAGD